MGPDLDTHFLQPLDAQATGNTDGGGEPSGEMAASGYILKTAIFDLCGEICMAGTGTVFYVFVVGRPGVLIFDNSCNGRTAGVAVHDTG